MAEPTVTTTTAHFSGLKIGAAGPPNMKAEAAAAQKRIDDLVAARKLVEQLNERLAAAVLART